MNTQDFFEHAKKDQLLNDRLMQCGEAEEIKKLAKEYGYSLKEDEIEEYLKDFLKNITKDTDRELTEDELKEVAGGLSPQTGNSILLLGNDLFSLLSKLLKKL